MGYKKIYGLEYGIENLKCELIKGIDREDWTWMNRVPQAGTAVALGGSD